MNDTPLNEALPTLSSEVLDQLRDLVDEETPNFLKDLLHSFLNDATEHTQAMKEGLLENDLGKVLKASHTLKSSSANLGALRLSQCCKTIEFACRNQIQEGLEAAIKQSQAELEKVRQEMIHLPDYN